MAEAGARQDQRAPFGIADAERNAGRNQHSGPLRFEEERGVDAGVQVEPGSQIRPSARETPAGQPGIEDLQLDLHRPSEAAIRSASRAATSRLVMTGQSSTPSSSTRWIVLRSPPKVPVPGETSLARIKSQRLRCRFARAFSTTCSVSAANPMTRAGRSLLRWAMRERMS